MLSTPKLHSPSPITAMRSLLLSALVYMLTSLHSPPIDTTSTSAGLHSLNASAQSNIGESFIATRLVISRNRGISSTTLGEQSSMQTIFLPSDERRSGSTNTQSKCSLVDITYSSDEAVTTSTFLIPRSDILYLTTSARASSRSTATTRSKCSARAMASTPRPHVMSSTEPPDKGLRRALSWLEHCSKARGGIMQRAS